MRKEMRISLVIPTYNRCDLLRRCLRAATTQTYPDYEVIVVDDASTDQTGDMVQREFPQVRYLRLERNRGPAAARNAGIAIANGEVIAFTDDDCELPADFLTRLADGYTAYPDVAGVGGYLGPPDELAHTNLFARYDIYSTRVIYRAGDTPYLGGMECPAGGTNSMSYRRAILEAVGGFDPTFPVPGGEDADLKRRVVERGERLLYVPVKVTHLRPYTLRDAWRQYFTHGRGVVHFERKHLGRPPSRARIALRVGVRICRWLPDAVRLGASLATIKLIMQIADAAGQWYELRQRREP